MTEQPDRPHPWLDPDVVVDHVAGSTTALPGALTPEDVETYRVAAAAYVEGERPELFAGDGQPGRDVVLGAVLLTARLWARKTSPVGLLGGFSDYGPAQIVRYDPDLERLLGIGRYAAPQIG